MATTSNFGWTTPDDTDLVKDGALAIRTLGNNIDTSLVDLKGGTTGQILSKNSNADLDYTWINNDQGDITGIQAGLGISVAAATGPVPIVTNDVATEFDAKGDLVVGTGDNTFDKVTVGTNGQVLKANSANTTGVEWANASPLQVKGDLFTSDGSADARLGVGANGETLVADSSQTTGLRYNPPATSLANPIINGGMDIWQRGTSISLAASTAAANGFNADRWQAVTGANQACTISRQATGDTTNLPNIQFALRFQRNSGQTGTGELTVLQNLETTNSRPFSGKTITFSFYARAGANYSPTSSALRVRVLTGTGTDQNAFSGYTGQVDLIDQTATLTTTWQRFAYTATVAATATQIGVGWNWTPTGTASTNDWFEVTGIQIDVGTWTASTAPTFRRSGNTLAGELAACQRYFYLHASGVSKTICTGYYRTNTDAGGVVKFPVSMRTAPTLTVTTGSNYYVIEVNNTLDNFDNLQIARATENSALIYHNSGISGTAGQAGEIYTGNNSAASVAFSAEL